MRPHFYALFWVYSLALATPTWDHAVGDLIRDNIPNSIPRNAAPQALADLERRVTTLPQLVPTATVNLGTDSTGTTQMASPLRDGGTIGTVATTAQPTSVAGADTTTIRVTGAGNAQSTSSTGGASASAVPVVGVILLGLLGL